MDWRLNLKKSPIQLLGLTEGSANQFLYMYILKKNNSGVRRRGSLGAKLRSTIVTVIHSNKHLVRVSQTCQLRLKSRRRCRRSIILRYLTWNMSAASFFYVRVVVQKDGGSGLRKKGTSEATAFGLDYMCLINLPDTCSCKGASFSVGFCVSHLRSTRREDLQ